MKYLNDGGEIEKNEDVMEEIMEELKQENLYFDSQAKMNKILRKQKKMKEKGMEVE